MHGVTGGRPSRARGPRPATRAALARCAALAAAAAFGAACGRAGGRPSEVVPGHAWRVVSAGGGPMYTFRAGQQVEMVAGGGMLMGTYQFPTDSTLALDVTGRIPGAGFGPMHLTPRFDVRVLATGPDGRERVELRAGTAVDTLARAD